MHELFLTNVIFYADLWKAYSVVDLANFLRKIAVSFPRVVVKV